MAKKIPYGKCVDTAKNISPYVANGDMDAMADMIGFFAECREAYGCDAPDIRNLGISMLKYTARTAEYFTGQTKNAEYLKYYWQALLQAARWRDVDSYFLYVEKNRDDDKKFYEPRREKFLQFEIIQSLQALIDDEIDLLTISMPPGTGKSTAGIFFLSGVMGWFPEEPNLASAHSGTLTRSFYEGVWQIIGDPDEYTWREIFPKVKIDIKNATNSKEQTLNVGKPKRFKSLTCRPINGSLTGATRCERILYADDLCSGIEEALNPARLDKLWMTYNTDLKTRKKNFAKEIHIATRWSTRDVIGRIYNEHEDDPRARFISIPALNEDGESNFDYDYGVGFSTEYFLDIQKSMDDVSFKCLFQNEPIEREGLLYNPDEFERYYELPDREPDAILGICDTKNSGSDFCFMPLFYQYGNKYFFEDCVYDNNGDVQLIDNELVEKLIRHNPHMVRFESNSAGGRIADTIQERIKGHCRTKITKKYTTANKETKIVVNSAWIKEHVILKDESKYEPKSPYGKAISALFSYSLEGKNKHDDVPDGMAMFAEFISGGIQKQAEIIKSPF